MGDLSANFSRHEFKCKCGNCSCDTVDAELLRVLEQTRLDLGAAITVNSGNRCINHNRRVGGATESQHVRGRASDITTSVASPSEVANYLEKKYPGKYGIGRYKNFTHIDTRSGPAARWRG